VECDWLVAGGVAVIGIVAAIVVSVREHEEEVAEQAVAKSDPEASTHADAHRTGSSSQKHSEKSQVTAERAASCKVRGKRHCWASACAAMLIGFLRMTCADSTAAVADDTRPYEPIAVAGQR